MPVQRCRRRRLMSIVGTAALLLLAGFAPGQYMPRAYYGATFEPVSQILHGAGQSYSDPQANLAFDYCGMLVGPDRYPIVFMAYAGTTTSSSFYTNLRNRLDGIQATTGKLVVPQIGFYFPSSGPPTADDETRILQMCTNLKTLNRPVFMRMGYEFNGTWYSPMYQPDSYKAWFQRLTTVMREQQVPAATVWCAYPGYSATYGAWDYLDDFYPGDDFVDWWSIDVFSPGDMASSMNVAFLNQAEMHGKPVMIGEATPTGVGAEDASDWDAWFEPFYNMIRTRKGIKGHVYINYDWAFYPSLSTWGDARLETADPYVRSRYIDEVSDPVYVHAGAILPDELMAACNAANEDADHDGVGDTCDMCPNTVSDASVDAKGCPAEIRGDFDGDGDVDQSDFGKFQACLSGPAVPQPDPACAGARLDVDGDVDLHDLEVFTDCLSGPDVPALPSCVP